MGGGSNIHGVVMSDDFWSRIHELRSSLNLWVTGSGRYIAVAAFVSGLDWATSREMLDGFQEFVSVTRSKETALGWHVGVLRPSLGDRAREVALGGGDDLENSQAIDVLFDALHEFDQLRQQNRVAEIKAQFGDLRSRLTRGTHP